MTRFKTLSILCSLAFPQIAVAQNPFAQMTATRKAIIAKDTATAFALLDSISAVVPDHPNYTYLRAHANGMAGRIDQARADITQLLKWDARYARAALRDSSVAALRSEFSTVDSLAKLAEAPVANGTVWAQLSEPDFIPEGTAWDPATKSILVGSLNKYRIVAIDSDGKVTERVKAGSAGIRSIVGIHVDSARGLLFAASNPRYDTPSDSTPSALFVFDAATGEFKERLSVPGTQKHFLNDITRDKDGTVYVTDTEAGRVWFANRGATELKELTALGNLLSPNGITVSSDGRVLFVAAVDHIQALDIASGKSWKVMTPDSINVTGIDGLAYQCNELIAHHPLSNWRLVRYGITSDFRGITTKRIIDANTPDGRTSTTGEIAGSDYVYIGNSQIDRMNAKTIDRATMEPVRIYRVRLY